MLAAALGAPIVAASIFCHFGVAGLVAGTGLLVAILLAGKLRRGHRWGCGGRGPWGCPAWKKRCGWRSWGPNSDHHSPWGGRTAPGPWSCAAWCGGGDRRPGATGDSVESLRGQPSRCCGRGRGPRGRFEDGARGCGWCQCCDAAAQPMPHRFGQHAFHAHPGPHHLAVGPAAHGVEQFGLGPFEYLDNLRSQPPFGFQHGSRPFPHPPHFGPHPFAPGHPFAPRPGPHPFSGFHGDERRFEGPGWGSPCGPHGPRQQQSWQPPVDVSTSAESYKLAVELPGLSRDEVEVVAKSDKLGGQLTISGGWAAQQEEGSFLRSERCRPASFSRTFELPRDAEPKGITAGLENGLLHVTIPRTAARTIHLEPVESESGPSGSSTVTTLDEAAKTENSQSSVPEEAPIQGATETTDTKLEAPQVDEESEEMDGKVEDWEDIQ